MRLLLLSICFVCSVAPAVAQSIPAYNSELYCKTLSGQFSDSTTNQFMMKSCLDVQAKSASQAKRVISSFDSATIAQCDAVAKVTGGSYQIFVGCLAMDVAGRFLDGKVDLVPKDTFKPQQPASANTQGTARSSDADQNQLANSATTNGTGKDMIAQLGCAGDWSDDKKAAIFNRDYKGRVTIVTGKVAKAGDGEVELTVMRSTLTYDVQIKLTTAREAYDLEKGQIITVRFIPTTQGGCILPFSGSDGHIVSKG